MPRGLNFILGAKFKVLLGYPTMASILFAMEQREVDATVINWSNLGQLKPDWISGGKIRVLAQVGGVRHKELPDTRLLFELVDNERLSIGEEMHGVRFLGVFGKDRGANAMSLGPSLSAPVSGLGSG